MAESVAEFMLRRLAEDWGVQRIYGYPGDGINGLMSAFQELAGTPEFVQVRHETIASYAACAHSKFTGEVGVCVATSGPGAVQLLNGLYDAKLDHRPVVAIVGQQKTVSSGRIGSRRWISTRCWATCRSSCRRAWRRSRRGT